MDLSPEETGRIGRITTIVLMLVAAAWAPMIRYFPGLWSYIQSVLSYLVPPVVAIFLLGVFWPRTNGNGAFVTLIGGDVLSLAVFVLSQMGYIELHFTINNYCRHPHGSLSRAARRGLAGTGRCPRPREDRRPDVGKPGVRDGVLDGVVQKLSGSCGRCARPDGGDAHRVLVTRRPSVDGGPPFLGFRFVGLVAALQLRGEEA